MFTYVFDDMCPIESRQQRKSRQGSLAREGKCRRLVCHKLSGNHESLGYNSAPNKVSDDCRPTLDNLGSLDIAPSKPGRSRARSVGTPRSKRKHSYRRTPRGRSHARPIISVYDSHDFFIEPVHKSKPKRHARGGNSVEVKDYYSTPGTSRARSRSIDGGSRYHPKLPLCPQNSPLEDTDATESDLADLERLGLLHLGAPKRELRFRSLSDGANPYSADSPRNSGVCDNFNHLDIALTNPEKRSKILCHYESNAPTQAETNQSVEKLFSSLPTRVTESISSKSLSLNRSQSLDTGLGTHKAAKSLRRGDVKNIWTKAYMGPQNG